MTHRPSRCIAALTLALAVTALAACTGDDDTEAGTSATVPVTEPTASATDPTTTASTSSTTSTTAAPTTAVDLQALKAQIAEDYLRSEQAREDLNRNPTVDNLEARVATITALGSENYHALVDFVRGMVERGERAMPGEPDYSEVLVESVELVDGTSSGQATVIACQVTNQVIVAPDGSIVPRTEGLIAVRVSQPVALTDRGWLPSAAGTTLQGQEGATSCPPA